MRDKKEIRKWVEMMLVRELTEFGWRDVKEGELLNGKAQSVMVRKILVDLRKLCELNKRDTTVVDDMISELDKNRKKRR